MPARSTPIDPWCRGDTVLGADLDTPIGVIRTSLWGLAQYLKTRDTLNTLRNIPDLHIRPADADTINWFESWYPNLTEYRDIVIRDNGLKKWFQLQEIWIQSGGFESGFNAIIRGVEWSDAPPCPNRNRGRLGIG